MTARSRTRVLALVPDASREEVEAALGAPVDWCDDVGPFLARLAEQDWAAVLLCMDHASIDEVVARRIAASPRTGSLFLTSRDRTVDRVVAAERAGSVALLAHP